MEGISVATRGGVLLFSTGIGVSLASIAADILLSHAAPEGEARSGRLVLRLSQDNSVGLLACAAHDASVPACAPFASS